MQKNWNESEKVSSNCDTELQLTSRQKKKKGKGPRIPVTPKLPEFDSHQEKVDFMINEFKVKLCTRRRKHTWSGCPYAHRGETARRRDPNTYHAVPCPEMRQGNRCPRGDSCCYSHHDFEYWLHPTRYNTVMCNKGTNCDRALCFFAHKPEELRPGLTNQDNSVNNDPMTTSTDQLSDSTSSSRNNFEKTGVSADDVISCESNTSLPEAFSSLQQKNGDRTLGMNPLIPPISLQECPATTILSRDTLSTALSRITMTPLKEKNFEPKFESPYSMTECTASSNINQLLSQRHSSPGIMAYAQSKLKNDEALLKCRLSSKYTSHFSPTCHFTGTSKEFKNDSVPQVASGSSMGCQFDQNTYFAKGGDQYCVDWMQNGCCHLSTQNCSAIDFKQLDLMQATQMTSPNQALDQDLSSNTIQAIDYFRTLEQIGAGSQTAALYPIASSSSSPLFGEQFRQDLPSNSEALQLYKLQLLCNLQGDELPSSIPSPSLFSPSLVHPQFSIEEAKSRDALYSLQEETSVFNTMLYLNLIQNSHVNNDNQF